MKIKKQKDFRNGSVYCLELEDGLLIETTDTFLPLYTKNAIGRNQNFLDDSNCGDRSERWMIGVSVMSGCPVRCQFCATGQMEKWRNLTTKEIVDQVKFIISKNYSYNPHKSGEFKINYTRMGEGFLNLENLKAAISEINELYPNTHHYVSTIGIRGSDFSWIKDNITLQISLHSLVEDSRNELIPYKKKLNIHELGEIRTGSNQKTTLNLTLVNESDFDINKLLKHFDKEHFFVKLSPINPNSYSDKNNMSIGVINESNYI
jgi:adenine C2-methylase RlmN of 23S rRNA A2503 and tRNA A37